MIVHGSYKYFAKYNLCNYIRENNNVRIPSVGVKTSLVKKKKQNKKQKKKTKEKSMVVIVV